MIKKLILTSVCLISLSSMTACTTSSQQPITPANTFSTSTQLNHQKIQQLFNQANVQGVLVIRQQETNNVYGNHPERANTAYVPASTFKILNALIGIEHKKTMPEEVFKWNGEKRLFPAWEKDLTLKEAIQASAIPVYQELAQRIGKDLMASEVKRISFGNSDIGTNLTDFWLRGPLSITPIQEVEFISQLADSSLAFSQKTQQQVQDMLFLEEINGKKIYGKTGWGWDVQPEVGWFTGWIVDENGKKTSFSFNLEMNKNIPSSLRKELTYQSLETLGLI